MKLEIKLKEEVDSLCDFTYAFAWQQDKLRPGDVIPGQEGTSYTYRDLVEHLLAGGDLEIHGDVGCRFGYSLGASIRHLGGSGRPVEVGRVFLDGSVGPEMGMAMVSGAIYLSGDFEEPLGNVVEVASEFPGYRKYISITDLLHKRKKVELLGGNTFNSGRLVLGDGLLRGTIAARCAAPRVEVVVEGDVYNGTGLLMEKGVVRVVGDAGMNTGAHLDGGTVVVQGVSREFAGAYMKKGILVLEDAQGYVGAGMKGGAIYTIKRVKPAPPAVELEMTEEEGKNLAKLLSKKMFEAMSYHKYGIPEEKYVTVRMRDGSVVTRPVEG